MKAEGPGKTARAYTGLHQFCKLCQECVAVCPEHLFVSAPFEEHWQEEEVRVS